MRTATIFRAGHAFLYVLGSTHFMHAAEAQALAAAPPTLHVRSMADVEALALDANHDVRLARIAVDGARAAVMQADTRPNPTLSWNGASFSPTSGLGSGNLAAKHVDQILRIDQTIERGDKRTLRVGVAQDQLLGKRVDLEEQNRQSLQLVRDAYIDLLLSERRVAVLDETRANYERSLDAATKRLKAGDLAAADLARLRVDVLRARVDADHALADHLHAQVALALLLDLQDDPRAVATDGAWPTFPDPRVPAGQADAVDQRPDLVSAQLAVRAASTSIDLARSQRTRDVTVGAQFERYPGPGGTGNTFGLGLSIPLFTGNDYGGDIAHAIADRDAAETNSAKLLAAARADLANALADLDAASRKRDVYRHGLIDAAKSAADAADFAFARGALGVMDVLDSRRTLLATQLDALDADAACAHAEAAVAAARTRSAVRVTP